MSEKIAVLGVDLSLTGTGLALITDFAYRGNQELIVGSRNLWLHTECVRDLPVDPQKRWSRITDAVMDLAAPTSLIIIEGYSFASQGRAIMSIAELGGICRWRLHMAGHTYRDVPPTTLKKFVSGRGNVKKNEMLLETYKRWNISFNDDNICDAYGLARLGLALQTGATDLPQFQQDVIANILNPVPKLSKKKAAV